MSKYNFELDMENDNSVSLIINMVKKESTVLEFGPANGRMTKYLTEKLGCTVDIVEIDEDAGKDASAYSRNFFVGNPEGDIEKFFWLKKLENEKYDYIIFADVLEHLKNPALVLKKVKGLLSNNGSVLLSVPNIAHNAIILNLFHNDFPYKDIGLLDNTHIHFFAYHSLKKMIEQCGYFTVLEKATYCKAKDTEFSIDYDSISMDARKALRLKKYGNIYQFVFKIADNSSEATKDEVREKKLDADSSYEFVCYYKTAGMDNYTEECCKRINFIPGDNKFLLKFDAGEQISGLRIDPLDCNCIIRDFHVVEKESAKELKVADTNGLQSDENEYIFATDDPMFSLNIPKMVVIKEIEVSFKVIEYENAAINFFKQLCMEKNEKIVELENLKDEQIAEIENLKDEQIAEIRNLKDVKISELEKLNEVTGNRLEKVEKELKHYKAHYFAAINQREELKSQLAEILNSECWKLTRPMRAVVNSMKIVATTNHVVYFTGKAMKSIITGKGVKPLFTDEFKATYHQAKLNNSKKKVMHYENEILDKATRKKQQSQIFDKNITFSIVVPLYNTPKIFLKEMIESVQQQTYRKWELCMADGSDAEHSDVGKLCRKYAQKDKRIKYKKLEKNLGISENTNAAIDMATGEYIGLFDHDDLLHPSVLFKNMQVIDEQNADFIYTDEMTFDGEINHVITMHYKPDFCIDNLRANNYICHFTVFKTSLLDKAGKFDSRYDGSQDHDMILRLTEHANHIVHIPEILYFWRSHPNSVAADINAKEYAIDAGKRAVKAHLRRMGMDGEVESSPAFPTIYRIRYQIEKAGKVSIIIPNCNHKADLQRCIDSILNKSTYSNYEIIIVENNSTEQEIFNYYHQLELSHNIKILYWKDKFNYSAINNFAEKQARGEYLLFLNNDIEVIEENWMQEMMMYAQRKDVAAVGAKLFYGDDTIQHAGVILGMGAHGVAGHGHYKCNKDNLGYMGRLFYAQDVAAVTAACMMMRKDVFEEIGGFEEKFVVAFNDVDLCMKALRRGYLNVMTPFATLYHYESLTRGLEETPEKKKRFEQEVAEFKRRWAKELEAGDPYYNKNLTLEKSDFSIK